MKWKIAKAQKHSTQKGGLFFLTALRRYEKVRKGVKKGEREGE